MPVLHWGRCFGKWPKVGSLLAPLLCVLGVHKLPRLQVRVQGLQDKGSPHQKRGCWPWDLLFRVQTPGGAAGFVVFIQSLSPLSTDCSMASFPCPSLSPEVCSNSGQLSQWCYLIISSSVTPFSFCLQSFPASGSFPMSQLFPSGGQCIGASVSASVFPMNVFVQSLSLVWLFLTPWTAAIQASLSFTMSQSLFKFMSIESMMPSNHLILCHPLLLLPLIFPSIRVFSNESALSIRWQKCGSFTLSLSPSNEYSGLIFFRMTGLISLQSRRLSRVFSSITVQKHQFFSAQPPWWSNSHVHTWLLEKPWKCQSFSHVWLFETWS